MLLPQINDTLFNLKISRFILFFNILLIIISEGSSCSTAEQPTLPEIKLLYSDVSYGNSASQKLDIKYPDYPDKISETVNVILFIHGGGWSSGDKDVYSDATINMSNYGLLAASMNYRMFDENANCEDMLNDIEAALNKIKAHAAEFKIKTNKVILMGASAGAHLSLLYTYKNHVSSPIPIAFCVSQCGPTDFTDPECYSGNLRDFYLDCASRLSGESVTSENLTKKRGTLLSVSPINYVSENIPPTLFSHGMIDEVVPVSNAYRLKDALKDKGASYDMYIYPNSGHGLENDTDINQAFFTRMFEYMYFYLNAN